MVTLKHPAFPDRVTQEVAPEDVARWVAAGWIDDRACCGDGPDGPCIDCPAPPEPDAHILPVDPPKPRPRRKPKNPSIGDD